MILNHLLEQEQENRVKEGPFGTEPVGDGSVGRSRIKIIDSQKTKKKTKKASMSAAVDD